MFGLAYAAERYGNHEIEVTMAYMQMHGRCVFIPPNTHICFGGYW
jgi:hypothetical protein